MLTPRFAWPFALAAMLGGCGGSGSSRLDASPWSDAAGLSDALTDGGQAHDAALEVRQARCCVLPTYASYSPYAGCNLLSLVPGATVNLIAACWEGDGGGFDRWQCGGQQGQDAWCSNGGLNCAGNDLCWVQTEQSAAGGCPGSVQDCSYPWR